MVGQQVREHFSREKETAQVPVEVLPLVFLDLGQVSALDILDEGAQLMTQPELNGEELLEHRHELAVQLLSVFGGVGLVLFLRVIIGSTLNDRRESCSGLRQ